MITYQVQNSHPIMFPIELLTGLNSNYSPIVISKDATILEFEPRTSDIEIGEIITLPLWDNLIIYYS